MQKLKSAINAERIREDFPILKRKVNGKPLVYLDNAATSQKPQQVIDALTEYYSMHNANIHRGVHRLSEEATQLFEDSHKTVSDFINADFEEVIFTKNCTESINLVAYSYGFANLKKGDEIIISKMEHHSNFVPWQQIAKFTGSTLKFADLDENGNIEIGKFQNLLSKKTKIVSVAHASNVLGTINPVREIAKIVHEHDAKFFIDAAQSVPHQPVDVRKLDCDFLAFSGHKMLGPTGIGALYGKKEILESMKPFLFGGDMIREVKFENTTFNDLPWKFEAGTPNIAGAVGLGVAIDYLKKIGMENIEQHGKELVKYAYNKLSGIDGLDIYGPDADSRGALIAFNLQGIHPHDVSAMLDEDGIAIRGGFHCAMPLMETLGIKSSARASFYLYNTKEEIDLLAKSLEKTMKFFHKV